MTDRPPLQLLMGSPVGAGCGLSRAGMSGVMVEVGGGGGRRWLRWSGCSTALRWLSVVNKQRQVPESLDGADLGSGAPGM